MTRRHKLTRVNSPLHNASPEHLLLLTIFGGEQLRRYVDNELDRRAFGRREREPAFPWQGGENRAA